jgi:hypothetical protein
MKKEEEIIWLKEQVEVSVAGWQLNDATRNVCVMMLVWVVYILSLYGRASCTKSTPYIAQPPPPLVYPVAFLAIVVVRVFL